MDQAELVQQIQGLELLSGMPDEARTNIARVFIEVSDTEEHDDGEALMHENYLGFGSGYVLAAGSVTVERSGELLVELSAPALLGEMAQFKSGDTRTATVKAHGPITALSFVWDEFYEKMKSSLDKSVQAMLMDAIEKLVWKRFGKESLTKLALFAGMDERQRLKVCIFFPWISERETYAKGEKIFVKGARCQAKGHLLTKGQVKVSKSAASESIYAAPNIIGIMPKNEPGLEWTANAIAMDDVEIYAFSWQTFTTQLQKRLAPDDQRALIESMKANAGQHFWH